MSTPATSSSEVDLSAANVEKMVLDFYRGPRGGGQDWLTLASSSQAAWVFAWELCNLSKNPEVQFFGANTLVIKVSKHFNEVSHSDFPMVRQRLLQLMYAYLEGRGPKIVMTRLCVAMSHLVMNGIPGHLWPKPIDEVMNVFQREMESRGIHVLGLLLELLTIIPEEFATSAMQSSKRAQVRCEFTTSLPGVVNIIQKVFNERQLPTEIRAQTMKCLQSWVQFGIPIEVVEELFERLIQSLDDEELYDCALDAMGSVVSQPSAHKHPLTMRRLLTRIVSLDTTFYKLMNEEAAFEIALPLASLFITFGESHSRMMLDWSIESEEGRATTLRLIHCILNVSSCRAQFPTQENLSEMPFGFWYIFQDDIIACEPQQFQQCVSVFGPIYHKLVENMLHKSMYPLNDSTWSQDQKEAFRCYRTDIADTIMYCYNILRDDLLKILLLHLDQAIGKCRANHGENWPYLEACLYAWSAIGESLAEEECALLPQFLAKLPEIPYNNDIKVISSALDCIGGFSELLYSYPQLLPHVLPLVTSAIRSPELSMCATMALKDLTRDCFDVMQPFAKDILNKCHEALNSNQLKNGESIRLMYPVGKMLSVIPQAEVMPYMEQFLMPYLTNLQQLSQQAPSAVDKPKVIFVFKVLTSLFQSLDSKKRESEKAESVQQQAPAQQPLTVVFPQLMPLIKSVAFKWNKDADVMDAVWVLVKQMTMCLSDNLLPFVQEIVELVLQCYSVEPHETALELCRSIFLLLCQDGRFSAMLATLFTTLITKTLQHVQAASNPSDHADLVSTFYSVLSNMIKKNRQFFGGHASLPMAQLIQFACACLNLPEVSTVKNAASFLTNFIVVSRDAPQLAGIVNQMGETIFRQVIFSIGGNSSNKSFVDYYADVLLALNKNYFDNLCSYVNGLVKEDGFPSEKITSQQKTHYGQLILRERANKRKLLEIIREFSLVCSGMEQSEDLNRVMAAWDRIDGKQCESAAATAD